MQIEVENNPGSKSSNIYKRLTVDDLKLSQKTDENEASNRVSRTHRSSLRLRIRLKDLVGGIIFFQRGRFCSKVQKFFREKLQPGEKKSFSSFVARQHVLFIDLVLILLDLGAIRLNTVSINLSLEVTVYLAT